jgi:hypothetical protein
MRSFAAIAISGCVLNALPQTVPGSYSVSWIGNSVGGTNDRTIPAIASNAYVEPNGTVWTNTGWEESNSNVSKINPDGTPGPRNIKGWGHEAGRTTGAITTDDNYVYHSIDNGFRRTLKGASSYPAEFTLCLQDGSHTVRGLAFDNGELFVGDADANLVRVFRTSDMTEIRSFSVTSPGSIAIEPNGDVWIIQMTGDFTGSKVLRYSRDGQKRTQEITGVADPVGIAISKDGRLIVADYGQDQNFKIYKNITSAPVLDETFGEKGGVFAGPMAGVTGPKRFCGPLHMGTDTAGNRYTICYSGDDVHAGGVVIEKYSATGTRLWKADGLMFEDAVEADPGTDGADVYGVSHHYKMDYTKTKGKEFSLYAHTISPFKYPHDVRQFKNTADWAVSAWFKRISDKPVMFVSSQVGGLFGIYRFNQATDGEIAIPSGYLSGGHITPKNGWPFNQPASGAWIWRDKNGNGNMDSDEYETFSSGVPAEGKCIDKKGDIWFAGGNTIRRFRFQGFDAIGNPTWNFTNSDAYTAPALFTSVCRVEYDSDNDVLYITGYTADKTEDSWGLMGKVMARYDTWTTGNRIEKWQTSDFNYSWSTNWGGMHIAKSITFVGDYLFMAYFGGIQVGGARIFEASTGTCKGTFLTTADLKVADVDKYYGIHGVKRSNGEYDIFVADHYYGKQTLYRWLPTGQVNVKRTTDAGLHLQESMQTSFYNLMGKKILRTCLKKHRGIQVSRIENTGRIKVNAF